MKSETGFNPNHGQEETTPEPEKIEKAKKLAIKFAAKEMLEGAS